MDVAGDKDIRASRLLVVRRVWATCAGHREGRVCVGKGVGAPGPDVGRRSRRGAGEERRPGAGTDGSYAEVAHIVRSGELTTSEEFVDGCDAVSQDLRRATSFSNRRQQNRYTP
ncbi:hypothetical protein GCM10010349_52250 [Streptomyces flavofungini]|nr:hypothetical protein GCM10010349_52250 [Streptomyces flavofungini]